ncbi:uncharacterized protein IAS62_006057 [Cryptococcus decagattii]|uniref:Uncharacterized protein n=1 Tax=Cryptococcus decagattii TaxID=1859122 RepID=A0ABZ2B201_9TREE
MADHAAAPVPLHLPAILQNPTNRAARQVEAHNAQQREKAAARRERDSRSNWNPDYNGKGKRVIRRLDNAAFASNPHIVRPTMADYTPPVPLQSRPLRPSFPAHTIPRSTPVPPALIPDRDPFSPDSRQGSFSTSLKGTRAMLRKRGKRAEGLVTKADTEIRNWLGGEWGDLNAQKDGQWRVIDQRLVDYAFDISRARSISSTTGRRLFTHRGLDALPDLPIENGQIPAILEISRSPAHLSWFLAESFDRLVVHLLSRYYELASCSQDVPTASGQILRVIHVVVPSIAQPNRHPIPGHSLATPETSEVSGQSSSESSYHSLSEGESSGLSAFVPSDSDNDSDNDNDSDTVTEMGDAEVVGYSIEEGDTTVRPIPDMSDLSLSENENELTRTFSAASSRYASSEGGSDVGTLGDSLTIPRISGHESEDSMAGGWVDVDDESDFGDIPGFSRVKIDGMYNRINPGVRVWARGWESKPTFFEYLYGV